MLENSNGELFCGIRDLEDNIRCQEEVGASFCDQKSWWRKSTLNVAGIGKFSPDWTIRQYAADIWGIKIEAMHG